MENKIIGKTPFDFDVDIINGVIELTINGECVSTGYYASRKLTFTDDEARSGVFLFPDQSKKPCHFRRGDKKVMVDFSNLPLNYKDIDPKEFKNQLLERVRAVFKAFGDEK